VAALKQLPSADDGNLPGPPGVPGGPVGPVGP
jgi:hypothetical protein